MDDVLKCELREGLSKFPVSNYLLKEYLNYVICLENALDFDLVNILYRDDKSQLNQLERILKKNLRILGVGQDEFKRKFSLSRDLLSKDEEKIHDIFAEILSLVRLCDDFGFNGLKKITARSKKGKTADFIATREDDKFAIEIKRVRMWKNYLEFPKDKDKIRHEEGYTLVNWGSPLDKGSVLGQLYEKIKSRSEIREQLLNTKKDFQCDKLLVVIDLGEPATALFENQDMSFLTTKLKQHFKLDTLQFIFFNGISGEIIYSDIPASQWGKLGKIKNSE